MTDTGVIRRTVSTATTVLMFWTAATGAQADAFFGLPPDTAAASDISIVGSGDTFRTAPDSALREIVLVGVERTKPEVIHLFLKLDTGSVYGAAALDSARARLLSCRAFLTVKFLPVYHSDGLRLFVVVKEYPRYHLSDIGGYIYQNIYGRAPGFWEFWRLNTSLRIGNIRGRLETFTVSTVIWAWRHLGVSWYKPLLPTPYYLSAGAWMSSYPFLASPWRSTTYGGTLVMGRRVGNDARISVGVSPLYNRLTYEGDSRPDGNPPDYECLDVFASFSSLAKRNDENYPFLRGWYAWAQLGFSIPAPEKPWSRPYVEIDAQVRAYHPAWPHGASVAYRLQSLVRSGDAGWVHVLETGSEHTIRGFGNGGLGTACKANNRAVVTAEYRVPLFATPVFRLPRAASLVVFTNDVFYRFDLVLFADAAHLWHELEHPFTQTETAMVGGAGLRIVIMPSKRAVCFDVVPAIVYNGGLANHPASIRTWGWHAYVDLAF